MLHNHGALAGQVPQNKCSLSFKCCSQEHCLIIFLPTIDFSCDVKLHFKHFPREFAVKLWHCLNWLLSSTAITFCVSPLISIWLCRVRASSCFDFLLFSAAVGFITVDFASGLLIGYALLTSKILRCKLASVD